MHSFSEVKGLSIVLVPAPGERFTASFYMNSIFVSASFDLIKEELWDGDWSFGARTTGSNFDRQFRVNISRPMKSFSVS